VRINHYTVRGDQLSAINVTLRPFLSQMRALTPAAAQFISGPWTVTRLQP
jgi:hypothetical protein